MKSVKVLRNYTQIGVPFAWLFVRKKKRLTIVKTMRIDRESEYFYLRVLRNKFHIYFESYFGVLSHVLLNSNSLIFFLTLRVQFNMFVLTVVYSNRKYFVFAYSTATDLETRTRTYSLNSDFHNEKNKPDEFLDYRTRRFRSRPN